MSRVDNTIHSREVLGFKPIPYSKTNKKHHLAGLLGANSNKGIKIYAELEDGTTNEYGSAYEAGRQLFNKEESGKAIIQAIKRGQKFYKNIKFSYEPISAT